MFMITVDSSIEYLETKVQGVQGRKRKQAQADDHKEPDWWIKLGLVVKTLNGGEDTAIPSQIPSELSKTHKALFKVARDCMQAFQAAPKKKRDQVLLKDAMVALSCTANLHSPKVGAYFEDDFLARAFNACMDSEIDHHEDLVRWLAPLREIARSGDASDVRDEALFKNAELTRERRRICALGARSLHEKVLDIVQQMCALVIERPFGDSPSETDALIAWANVYKTLLPTGITISTGETWLRATLPVHSELAAELGTEAGEGGGRRVDMRFLYNDIEVSNVELKARSRKTSERATQTRKNLRLARCIQRELERLGVPTPEILFADVSGYMGIFSKVVKLDDIYVAGRVTDQVVTLPTSMYTLRQFLEGSSLSVIINFLSHLERLGMAAWDAAAAKEASDSESDFVEDVEYDVDESYPTEKRFEDNILLTPKKKRV
ncbi:hypothetical protein BC939DRAFT_114213 [Gamsiella multidivaricata]|uniref:uncharacterized protein n=1 Tax=Gamsiella multidivaricata TaxID=101098 RepID=UPI00221FB1D7|nr:uncharacterized protein BC939DRAFT_114213 [Gamsiella multidivaricata]KAI7826609.1 hypothetical protein BC939DRAFT_114213 [Gamsiella multidivaricata]